MPKQTAFRREVLKEKRAEYEQEIVGTLSQQLTVNYGRNFDVKNLWWMQQFAEFFPKEAIVVTVSRQLSWSRFEEDRLTPDLVFPDRCSSTPTLGLPQPSSVPLE